MLSPKLSLAAASLIIPTVDSLSNIEYNTVSLSNIEYNTNLQFSPSMPARRLPPHYLSSLITNYHPPRSLRSSNRNLLDVPRSKSAFSNRGFRTAGPQIWNSLPDSVCHSASIVFSDLNLKLPFSSPPSAASAPMTHASDSMKIDNVRVIKFIYHITYIISKAHQHRKAISAKRCLYITGESIRVHNLWLDKESKAINISQ